MLNFHRRQIYLFFSIIVLFGCQRQERPDLSQIELEVQVERFDQAFDSLATDNIGQKNEQWKSQYGSFYYDYMRFMLEAGDPDDSVAIAGVLAEVIQTPDYAALSQAVQTRYPSMDRYERELTDAFKHILYYFPDTEVPRFISFLSGFGVQTPIGEDYIGIGLDMFLGADSEFYPALRGSIPFYISRRFTPENIVPRVVEAFAREELFPYQDVETHLLDQMVQHGKILYFMDRVLPGVADTLKIGYTTAQMQWAQAYERDIWAWFLSEELLYEYDFHRTQKHLGEAPFTPELGEQNESAPKLGVFLGWNIVRQYMDRNPEVTLPQLMATDSGQAILDGSRYRGR